MDKLTRKEIQRRYREKNRDKLNEKNREYRKNNKEKVKETNDNWSKNNRDKVNARAKVYRDKNKDKTKNLSDIWYQNNKERVRYNKIKRIYGLTKEQFEEMLKQQNNCCATCGIKDTDTKSGYLVIDHCHTTGKVRGLLCNPCNTAIGLLKENKQTIGNLVRYLFNEV